MIRHTFVLLLVVALNRAETYENSSSLCVNSCVCSKPNENTLVINCERIRMHHTIANWPPHSNNLIATFSHNAIITLEPMPASKAKHVKIAFANCSIKYLKSGLFESISTIEYVDLSHNLLESDALSEQVFKGPYNQTTFEPIALQHLDLSYNKLHTLDKNLFRHTPYLTYLNLEGNFMRILDQITCFALSTLGRVQTLNLAQNGLTELPIGAIHQLKSLQNLNLSFNDLDFPPRSLGYVAITLHTLDLSNNPIIDLEVEDFEGMKNLTLLRANNLTELTRIKARTFAHLSRLTELHLSHNHRLSEIDESALVNVPLRKLALDDNALEDLPIRLVTWESLQEFDIVNNHFVCSCNLMELAKRLSWYVLHSKNIPYCRNVQTTLSVNIYTLNECIDGSQLTIFTKTVSAPLDYGTNVTSLKIAFSATIVFFILVFAITLWLSYQRWRKGRSVEFLQTQVRYNRLPNQQQQPSRNGCD